jgi:hypothetical protein
MNAPRYCWVTLSGVSRRLNTTEIAPTQSTAFTAVSTAFPTDNGPVDFTGTEDAAGRIFIDHTSEHAYGGDRDPK